MGVKSHIKLVREGLRDGVALLWCCVRVWAGVRMGRGGVGLAVGMAELVGGRLAGGRPGPGLAPATVEGGLGSFGSKTTQTGRCGGVICDA